MKASLLRPPRWLTKQSKAALARRVIELSRELERYRGIGDTVEPFTIDRDMKAGDTIMVRIPKRFQVSPRMTFSKQHGP